MFKIFLVPYTSGSFRKYEKSWRKRKSLYFNFCVFPSGTSNLVVSTIHSSWWTTRRMMASRYINSCGLPKGLIRRRIDTGQTWYARWSLNRTRRLSSGYKLNSIILNKRDKLHSVNNWTTSPWNVLLGVGRMSRMWIRSACSDNIRYRNHPSHRNDLEGSRFNL